MKTKSRLSFKVLLVILLSFMLLTTVSYAWFYANVNLGGNTIETDSLEYEAYGYNSSGTVVSTILNEGQTSTATNVNSPLYSNKNFTSGSATVYVSIKSNSSMDLEYNLSIIARGYGSSDLNFTESGGYWYRISDITSKVSTLSAYITSYKNTTESGTKLNMNTMNTTSVLGSIGASDSNKTKYYRIDFGVDNTSNTTSNRIELFANVEVDQKGNTNNTQGSSLEYKISDSTSLINAIENASNLDTLYFTNDVEYFGDLIIRKHLNMNLGGKTLTVTGNVVYNFQSSTTLKLDLSGSGKLKVISANGSDGNLIFDTPNAQIEIKGTSSNGGLIVENDIIVSCSNVDNKMGCHLSGVKAVKPDGSNATIKLNSNTTVTISSETSIDSIVTEDNSMNIKIVNNGSIGSVVLSNMKSSTQTASPQIYIHNYSNINSISLPSWSTKFVMGTSGTNTGNTKIANSFGAQIASLSGSSTFGRNDILEVSSTVFVESVDGTNANLRVLFKNKTNGSVTTIQGLLTEYFTDLGYSSSNAANQIKNITRLEIDAVDGKYFATADLNYINSASLSGLKTLDLTDANFTDYTLPTSFYNQTNLTELLLPKNLLRINSNAFGSNIKVISLTIPESVVALGENALSNIRYAIFESTVPPKADVKGKTNNATRTNGVGSTYNFVPEDSVDAYNNAFIVDPGNNWTDYSMSTYPYAILCDDGAHFVRALSDGTYELVVADSSKVGSLVSNNKYVIGSNLKIDGIPITISTVGRCAYLNFRSYTSYTVTFVDSIHTICWRSFDNAYFKNIDFCSVQIFEDWCGRGIDISNQMKFSNCERIDGKETFTQSKIKKVDTGNVKYITGSSTFSACSNMVEIKCPELIFVGNTCEYRCNELISLYMPKVQYLSTNGISENNKLYEVSLPSIREVGYACFNKCPSLISLHFGPNLTKVDDYVLRVGTVNLDYLFIECNAYIKMQFLLNNTEEKDSKGNYTRNKVVVDHIYVSPNAYQGYYSALNDANNTTSKKNRDNLLDYGTYRVGNCIKSIYYNNKLVVDYNAGEYVVSVDEHGVTILSYNVETIPTTYEIPKTLVVNGVEMPVVAIGRNAFRDMAVNPTSLNNVESIGECAFYNCDSLVTINAPQLKTVGASAFEGCALLATANIPQLSHWSNNLFKDCPKLTKIVSACKFTSEASAISGTTTKVTNITIDYEVNSSADLPATTVFSGLKSKCANVVLYVRARSLATFKANSVFNALTPTALEQKVTDSNSNNFYLTQIVINSTTYYQVDYVEGNGSALIIPTSYNSINVVGAKEGAYNGVSASSVTIPQYYIYVNDGEFSNITGLASFSVNSNNAKLKVVDYALYSKDGLELIAYPNSRTATSYSINSATKIIRNSAFENVKNLTSVTFNSNISYIGTDAFKASSVTTFDFSSETAPYLMGANALGSNVATIKVPSSLLNAYKASFRLYSDKITGK